MSRLIGIAGLLVLILTLPGCERVQPRPVSGTADARHLDRSAAEPTADPAIDELLKLIKDRLLLMHDVARSKWNRRLPITDPERERELLAKLEREGLAHGLDADLTRSFMASQIKAGKRIQEADFARWRAERRGSFVNVPDLQTELRPRIDQVSQKLLASLSGIEPRLEADGSRAYIAACAAEILQGHGIDETVRRTAIQPLLGEPPALPAAVESE